jgi:hypothetical protein
MSFGPRKEAFTSELLHPIRMPTGITGLVSAGLEERELARYLVMKLLKQAAIHLVRHFCLLLSSLLKNISSSNRFFTLLQADILPVSRIL